MKRKLTKNIIKVICNGSFIDVNNKTIPYRVMVELPNCLDEWLKSNIKNRYIVRTIRQGKELTSDNKEVENKYYYDIRNVREINIEQTDKNGESAIIETDRIPSFYGKSIFNFNIGELQDFATAFGLHEIQTKGDIDVLRKDAILAYLKRVKKLKEEDIKSLSFYKYDKTRQKYYIEFSEEDKKSTIINNFINVDIEEFKEQDEEIEQGTKSIGDLFRDINDNNDISNNNTNINIEDNEEGTIIISNNKSKTNNKQTIVEEDKTIKKI